MLSTLEKTIILKGTELFEAIPAEEVFHVAKITEERRLQAQESLFHQGDPGDSLYIIVTGEIRIHIEGDQLNRLSDGAVVGELAVLDGEPRSASATAVDETILLKISQESFYEILDSRKEVMREIFKELTGRIRRLTDLYMQNP